MGAFQTSNREFDVAVIGGGSAGFNAAQILGRSGKSTVVIEGAQEIGGLCILRGCMPTKALLYAAEVLHSARSAEVFGLRPGKIGFDFKAVMQHKEKHIRDFADYRRKQLEEGPFKFIRATARFSDPHHLEIDDGTTVRFQQAIIASGSHVASPPLPQLNEVGYLTSDTALNLKKLPQSILILGGGAVAVEFAQFFRRFDVDVTLVQRSPHILKDIDEDATCVVEDVFRREGMTLYTGTELTAVWRRDGLKGITFTHQGTRVEVAAEEIFHGLGRTPNTEELRLESSGVETRQARILSNARMQTSAPHIYAAGDCTGPFEIVHIAIQQAEIAAHNILHPDQPQEMDYRLLTQIVFTDPNLASVGLTEKAAVEQGISYQSARFPFDDHGKSLLMEARDGFVKLLSSPSNGEILGGTCVGLHGAELIHEIIAAMAKRMTVRELARMPHYHPTLSEIWTYPAEDLAGR